VDDTPLVDGAYRPKNAHDRYRGTITLRQAFAVSSNVAAVRLARQTGMKAVIRAARDLGVTAPMPENESVALGSSGMPLVELAQAYAAVAAGQYPVRAHGLPEQEQGWFAHLLSRQSRFSTSEREMLSDLLSAAANGGTGRRAALRTATFGKTGTSQDNRDAIFVGYAGGLVTAVWVGKDDNSPLPGLSGGGLPARIWRNIMVSAVENGAVRDEQGKKPTLDAIDDAASAIANASIQTELGNVAIEVRPDSVQLRGAGGLSIDVPISDTPATAPSAPEPAETPQ